MLKSLLLASALTIAFSGSAMAQTTMEITTGYDHANMALYPAATSDPSTVPDTYWIKVASSDSPPVSTTSVMQLPVPGWVAYPGSHWINGRTTSLSTPGTSPAPDKRAYSIYRKCFCMLKAGVGKFDFKVHGDDNIQVWFNGLTNTFLGPVGGQWNTGGYTINRQSEFLKGKNCIYVMVEDVGGRTGFNLKGSITANGLLPVAAQGVGQSYAPCQCPEPGAGPIGGPGKAAQATAALPAAIRNAGVTAQSMEEAQMISGLIAYAESRRKAPIAEIGRQQN